MEKKFKLSGKVVTFKEPPFCTICGKEIGYVQDSKNTFKLTTCTNPECIAHNNKSYKIRTLSIFGKDALDKWYKKKRESNPLCKEYWIKQGLTENEAVIKIQERQSYSSKFVKNRGTCDRKSLLQHMTEEETDLFLRKKSRYCIEYWTSRGYTEDEAIAEIHTLQSKYGQIAKEKYKRENSWRCKEFWIQRSGCTEEEAIRRISEGQKNFSKEKCIEKYGKVEGLKRWQERQDKWQESLHKSDKLHVGFSKVSQDLFDTILSKYKEGQDYVFYGSKNHEYCIRENNQNYIYDFTDLNKRKIIEFQGDIYHGNPLLFEETDHPNPYKKDKTCKDLWAFDKEKEKVANRNGFSEMIIWEKEYRENKEEIINRCLKFLEIC